MWSVLFTMADTWMADGANVCRRKNANSRWVNAAARSAPVRAISTSKPMETPVSMLLKSWAMPLASWPGDSIFWPCLSRSSIAISSSVPACTRSSSVAVNCCKRS
ncbi:hypothetical protein G6F40_016174 [Rhizopus arrhizus]|nr:hypothetical protein G6F40_016174 [Rhizopus arrhizus]